jgi:hypothetical protein
MNRPVGRVVCLAALLALGACQSERMGRHADVLRSVATDLYTREVFEAAVRIRANAPFLILKYDAFEIDTTDTTTLTASAEGVRDRAATKGVGGVLKEAVTTVTRTLSFEGETSVEDQLHMEASPIAVAWTDEKLSGDDPVAKSLRDLSEELRIGPRPDGEPALLGLEMTFGDRNYWLPVAGGSRKLQYATAAVLEAAFAATGGDDGAAEQIRKERSTIRRFR